MVYVTGKGSRRSGRATAPSPMICPRSRTVIIIGQLIGKLPGLGWVHVACLVRRQPMIGPHSGA